MNRILNTYIPQRSDIVLAQLFRQGILPDFDSAVISVKDETIEMLALKGTIYYTLDGTDPRMIGGEPSPISKVYQSPIEVSRGITVKSRVLYRNEWSVLSEIRS